MKLKLAAIAIPSLFAVSAWAGGADPGQMTLEQVIAYVQYRFPGQVTVAKYDRSDSERGHYQVDVRFAHGRTAKLDVDAATGEFASLPPAMEVPHGFTVAKAVSRVTALIPGKVTSIEFDASRRGDPHYHVELTLESGASVPMRVDPAGVVLWRDALAMND